MNLGTASTEYYPEPEIQGSVPPHTLVAYNPEVPPSGIGKAKMSVPDPTFGYMWPNNQYVDPSPFKATHGADVLPSASLSKLREEIADILKDKLGISLSNTPSSYRKPYHHRFDLPAYPTGFRTPEFVKFSGEDNRSTREHISQFFAQLGELADKEAFRIRLFSLSLTGTTFAWYASLPPNSINAWVELEQKFHDHFFTGDYELGLTDLVSVRQGCDESVNAYLKRFRDMQNRCFQLSVCDRELTGLAFNGLRPYLREKLEITQFLSLAQLHQRASACESRSKEAQKSARHGINTIEAGESSSDDESGDICAAEFVWSDKAKTYACTSLKTASKSRQEEKFTFDVSKYEKIFDELLKNGKIKMMHVIPSADELKKWAYCKWHNTYSHCTNDCVALRRQVQSAINEHRLSFPEMQADK